MTNFLRKYDQNYEASRSKHPITIMKALIWVEREEPVFRRVKKILRSIGDDEVTGFTRG